MLKKLNKFNKTFIIAEAGSNHLRSFSRVKKLINIASKSGADAIKFQSFTADEIATKNKKYNIIKNKFKKFSRDLHSFYKKYELPLEYNKKIISYCKKKRIIFLTSIFGMHSYNFLKKKLRVIKIASFESNYFELLNEIIKDKKHLIISTGCSNEKQILKLKNFFNKKKYKNFSILHCGSSYPLPFKEANLKFILKLKKIFPKNLVGYSDHTLGISSSIAAVSLGAKIVEKHFTINKRDGAPDSSFSIDAKQLTQMVKSIREVEQSLGQEKKLISKNIYKMKSGMRSYYANKDFMAGTKIKPGMFLGLRPHVKNSVPVDKFFNFIDKKLKNNIKSGEVLLNKHL